MSALEGVKVLLRHATRGERPVIERLALAAGLFWRCHGRDCKHVNEDDVPFCAAPGCGRPRPGKP